ncbi:ProQ/FINO family protein [Saccharospirillum mangrovi]|uniref:ProQ/FINO family protein n=1 Tax=Saccharospirillum mangrovi TaxID=2161747 RepID=UPI000D33BA21|nr:ProQ/FINO family protein [Saccharospirillum mangrovi]
MTDENTQGTPAQQPTSEATNSAKKKKTDAQRKKEFEANRQAMDELCELYPNAFNPRQPKPLKIGIHETLAEDGKLSKTRIRRALNVYVRLRSYYACMVEGADRVSIDGSAAGTVSAEDAGHAKEKLDAIDKRRAERTAKAKPKAKKAPRPKAPAKAQEERLQRKLEALVNKPKND